ncbi:uncharacterized protein LOC120680519 isoform X4 [Panicum virgatum]|uniref:uncharacterized protein LOC120680519 isoform X4 n=1 Tax=Panicum virgatum TaxID=38727 RepID=UPI0019D67CC9|nr:uncharacterized protein LOC120680519 isoform X4 [Panicum virgatum]
MQFRVTALSSHLYGIIRAVTALSSHLYAITLGCAAHCSHLLLPSSVSSCYSPFPVPLRIHSPALCYAGRRSRAFGPSVGVHSRTLQPHGEKYKCVGPTCSGTGGPRYSLPIIATDLVAPREQQNERTIQLVFFGSIAQEIIDTPVGTLIAANEGVGIFLPTKITAIYGKQYELRVSISSMSLQHINITYQVDAIIGMGSIPASTPPHLHLALEGQPSHQSATESQQLHSTDKSTLITGTAPNGSGSTPPECNKDISSALPHIDISGTENTKFEIHARTKAPESSESNLLSTLASVEDLEKAQVYLITSYLLYCIENQIPFDYVIQQDYTCLSPCILLTQRQKRTNVRLMRHLIAMVKMIQGMLHIQALQICHILYYNFYLIMHSK